MRFFRIYNHKKTKNKIVHLMMMEKFTESYIRSINNLFSTGDNNFVIYGGPVHKGIELHCLNEKNVYTVMNGYLFKQHKYRNFLLNHKKIIIHGLFEAGIIENWSNDRELLAKTYIVLFGAYATPERINDSSYREIIQNAAGIINLLKAENKLVEKLYRPYGKLFHASYFPVFEPPVQNVSKDSRLNIQIGNSAEKSAKHIHIIDLVSKFKNENIRVYVPLSYGDMQYANEVKIYGQEKLGNKFVAILEFIPKKEYTKLLNCMDIAIFGAKRQCAMGNININIYLGNCVYLSRDSILAEFYEREMGCKIKYIEDIRNMDFEGFKSWKEQDGKDNTSKIVNYHNVDAFKKRWKYVFDYSVDRV